MKPVSAHTFEWAEREGQDSNLWRGGNPSDVFQASAINHSANLVENSKQKFFS